MTAHPCPHCGADVRAGAKFCTTCGTSAGTEPTTAAVTASGEIEVTPPDVPATVAIATEEPVKPSVSTMWQERNWGGLAKLLLGGQGALGVLGGVLVIWFVTSFLSNRLWTTLRWPAQQIQERIRDRDCASLQPGTWDMYVCSARVGFFRVLGPLVVVLLSILFRKPLTALIRRIRGRLPAGGGLVSPVVVAMLFTMAYSQIHRDTTSADLGPLIPQKVFPAVIAVFTYLAMRVGPRLTSHLGWFFRRRDRIPMPARIALAILVPIVYSYFLTNEDRVTDPARKEQLVIMASMITSYLAVVPTSGRFTGSARSWLRPGSSKGTNP